MLPPLAFSALFRQHPFTLPGQYGPSFQRTWAEQMKPPLRHVNGLHLQQLLLQLREGILGAEHVHGRVLPHLQHHFG